MTFTLDVNLASFLKLVTMTQVHGLVYGATDMDLESCSHSRSMLLLCVNCLYNKLL